MNEHPKCECHECTQARWRMFSGGGFQYTWPTKADIFGRQPLQPNGVNASNPAQPTLTAIGPIR